MSNIDTSALMWELLLDSDISSRYHSSRASFLSTIEKVLLIFLIIVSILALAGWADKLFSMLALLFSSILLICNSQKKALYHYLLKNRYYDLKSQIEIADGNKYVTYDEYLELKRKFDSIHIEDEERYSIVEAVCHNQVINTRKCDISYLIKVSSFQSYLMHFWPFYRFFYNQDSKISE